MAEYIYEKLGPDVSWLAVEYAKPPLICAIRRGDAPAWFDPRDPGRWTAGHARSIVQSLLTDGEINRHPHIPKWLVDTFGFTHYDFAWWSVLTIFGTPDSLLRMWDKTRYFVRLTIPSSFTYLDAAALAVEARDWKPRSYLRYNA